MKGILKTIVDRIIEEEGPLFREFDADSFPVLKRKPPVDPFVGGNDFAVIAEIKKASPSKGLIREYLDPAALAREYEKGGASAVSVVTEKNFFLGEKDSLRLVRKAVSLPVLRKDFMVHERQIYESFNLGADMVLLIAACLDRDTLSRLVGQTEALGMTALVEIHGEDELDKALDAGPHLVGINNRDLETFEVDWTRSLRIRPLIPAEIRVVSESGIRSHDQVSALRESGFSGILVGEHLMRRENPARAIEELIHG